MNTIHRNLIISPVGDDSLHGTWLSGPASRTFDLFLIHYGKQPDFGRADATYYAQRRGFKWELMHYALAQHPDIFARYRTIWCPDHDIRVNTAGVNRLFDVFEHYHLQIAQPAIAAGEVSYKTLQQKPGVILRYSPYVEIMCPIFTRDAFRRVSHTFLENRSGWGIDWVWPRYFRPGEIAIIDAVGVEHTGKLMRGENYQRLAALGIDPRADFKGVITKYGGFSRRLHRQFVRGSTRLVTVPDPSTPSAGFFTRLAGRLLDSAETIRA
jgi:hypothetical protein